MTNAKVMSIIDIEKLKAEKAATAKRCCIDGCENIGEWVASTRFFCLRKGMCRKHYERFKRHGSHDIVLHTIGENRHKHPLYRTYTSMFSRCNNANREDFKNYGGRGIKVCDEWLGVSGFAQFILDMGARPANYSLDRKEVDKGYCKSNCRWATWHEQHANKRKNNAVVGVSYHTRYKSWSAQLKVNGTRYQKTFKTEQEAINYRMELEKKYL